MTDAAAITTFTLQCKICGDNASAFNFGALSCESCKAFFRRAARSSKAPVCLFSGDCAVSLRTRRFCAACRLRKCQTVGMNKDLILSDEQRRERQQVIENNRLRNDSKYTRRLRLERAALPVLRQSMPSTGVGHRLLASRRASPIAAVDQKTALLVHPQLLPAPPLPISVASSRSLPNEHQQENENEYMKLTCDISWIACSQQQSATSSVRDSENLSESFASLAMLPSPRPPEQRHLAAVSLVSLSQRSLSAVARDILDVLTRLYKSKLFISQRLPLRRTMAADVAALTGQQDGGYADRTENRLQQLAFRVSDVVGGYVLFARELPSVAHLPVGAQVALVKACAPTFILLRAVELYDEARAAWVDELGDVVPAAVVDDLLSTCRHNPEVEACAAAAASSRRRRRFFDALSAIKRQISVGRPSGSPDQTVVALLQAIALLSPELVPPDALSQDELAILADAQQLHAFLLCEYLEATYSFKEAAELWPKLLYVLAACKRHARCLSDVLLTCEVMRRDDLLDEILGSQHTDGLSKPPSISCAAD